MNPMKKFFCIFYSFILLVFVSGCALMSNLTANVPDPVPQVQAAPTINEAEDKAAKELLAEYFSILFSVPSVDIYTENTRTGKLPDTILDFIAEKTIQEGNGNPEIGIHLPRFISINGMTIIGYDVVRLGEEAKPDVTSGFIAENGENILYFCKINAKVKVVPDEIFNESYKLQQDNTYYKLKNIPAQYVDGMRVEIRYDVELEKNNGKLKVLRAIESNIKPGLRNRLFILNNDNITRLQYLDISRTPDDDGYNNPSDGEIYEAEKAVITAFFENLIVLDRERMNLLSHKWGMGLEQVKDYWDRLNITKNEEGTNVIKLTEEYDVNYPYESLPLRFNMEKIKSINDMVVTPHPAYSEKLKWYFVNFDASVQRTNGITDEDFLTRYDYLVTLSEEDGGLIVQKIKLNEYYTVQ